MPKALIPGSFDPVTAGHLDIIRRAAAEYDAVTVGIFVNNRKSYLFDEGARAAFLRAACRDLPNVTVAIDHGYTADFARAGGFDAIVRGYRDGDDLTYEREMAAFNLARGGVPTRLMQTAPAYAHCSSSRVRELLCEGGDPTALLPPACAAEIVQAAKEKARGGANA